MSPFASLTCYIDVTDSGKQKSNNKKTKEKWDI